MSDEIDFSAREPFSDHDGQDFGAFFNRRRRWYAADQNFNPHRLERFLYTNPVAELQLGVDRSWNQVQVVEPWSPENSSASASLINLV